MSLQAVPRSTHCAWTTSRPGGQQQIPCRIERYPTGSPQSPTPPVARLSNAESDAIHAAHRQRQSDPDAYHDLVNAALQYKESVVDQAESLLEEVADLATAGACFAAIESRVTGCVVASSESRGA